MFFDHNSAINLDSIHESREQNFNPFRDEPHNLFDFVPKRAEFPKNNEKEENLDFKIDNVLLDVEIAVEEANRKKKKEVTCKKYSKTNNVIINPKLPIDLKTLASTTIETQTDNLNSTYHLPPITVKIQKIYDMTLIRSKDLGQDEGITKEILLRGDYEIEDNNTLAILKDLSKTGNDKSPTSRKNRKRNEVMAIDILNFDEELYQHYTRKDYKEIKAEKQLVLEEKGKDSGNFSRTDRLREIKSKVDQSPKVIQELAFLELMRDLKSFFQKIDEAKEIMRSYITNVNFESFMSFNFIEGLKRSAETELLSIYRQEKDRIFIKQDLAKEILLESVNKIISLQEKKDNESEFIKHVAKPLEKYITFLLMQVGKFPINEEFFKYYGSLSEKYQSLFNMKSTKMGTAKIRDFSDFETFATARSPRHTKEETLDSQFGIFSDINKILVKFKKYFYISVGSELKGAFTSYTKDTKTEASSLMNLNFSLISTLFLSIENYYLELYPSCCGLISNYLTVKYMHCFSCESNVCKKCLKQHLNHDYFDISNIYKNKFETTLGYDYELFPKKVMNSNEEQAQYCKFISDSVLLFIMRNTTNPIFSTNILDSNRFNDTEIVTIVDYMHQLYIEYFFKEIVQIIRSPLYAAKKDQEYKSKGFGFIDQTISNFNRLLQENSISSFNFNSFLESIDLYKQMTTIQIKLNNYRSDTSALMEECLIKSNLHKKELISTIRMSNPVPSTSFSSKTNMQTSESSIDPKQFYYNNFIIERKTDIVNEFLNNFYLTSAEAKAGKIPILERKIKALHSQVIEQAKCSENVNKHAITAIGKSLARTEDKQIFDEAEADDDDNSIDSMHSPKNFDENPVTNKLKQIKIILSNQLKNKFSNKRDKPMPVTKKRKPINTNFEGFPDIKDNFLDLQLSGKILVGLFQEKPVSTPIKNEKGVINEEESNEIANYFDENFFIKNGFRPKLKFVAKCLEGLFDLVNHYGKVVYKRR